MTWKSDFIQFPRLIAEICATQDLDVNALAESMDLDVNDVHDLLDRAQMTWASMSSPQRPFIVTSHSPIDETAEVVSHESVVRQEVNGDRWALAWVRLPGKAAKIDERQMVMPCLPPCRLT